MKVERPELLEALAVKRRHLEGNASMFSSSGRLVPFVRPSSVPLSRRQQFVCRPNFQQPVHADCCFQLLRRAQLVLRHAAEVCSGDLAMAMQRAQSAIAALVDNCRACACDLCEIRSLLDAADVQGLRGALAQRFITQEVLLTSEVVAFTHDTISPRFSNGPHCGVPVTRLAEALCAGLVDPLQDPSLLLEGVFFHGKYRSLNNRRLWCLRQAHCPVRLRVLPIVPWVRTATGRPVDEKFFEANSTADDGYSVRFLADRGGPGQNAMNVQ